MGGTGWSHIGPYRGSIAASLRAIQREVFASGQFQYWLDDPSISQRPATFEEFWSSEKASHPEGGTHSILDVSIIAEPEQLSADLAAYAYDEKIYPLSAEESRTVFGTAEPTRADFEHNRQSLPHDFDRGSGRCVVLYREGQPDEVAFWGSSGF